MVDKAENTAAPLPPGQEPADSSSLGISIPPLEFPDVLLPTQAQLTNLFNQVTALPPKLARQGYDALAEQIRGQLQAVEAILGDFPISLSKPVFPGIESLEMEWERRISALIREFHTFVPVKLIEILSALVPALPTEFNIFGIDVKIPDIFTSSEHRAEIRAQIGERVDDLIDLLPGPIAFNGQFGTESLSMKIDSIFSSIISKLNNLLIEALVFAFQQLIKLFKEAWDLLGLPEIPDLSEYLEFDVEAFLSNLWEQAKRTAVDSAKSAAEVFKDLLESINIFGFTLPDILGGETKDNTQSLERTVQRYVEAIKDFAVNFVKTIFFTWIGKIVSFLEEIGLQVQAILDMILLTFKDFMSLLGVPSSIDLSGPVVQTQGAVDNTASQ